jgi:hypothetical protein
MWMAFSSGIELKFDTYWIIHTGEALRYGAFVVPSLRGRGIYSVLNSALRIHKAKLCVDAKKSKLCPPK